MTQQLTLAALAISIALTGCSQSKDNDSANATKAKTQASQATVKQRLLTSFEDEVAPKWWVHSNLTTATTTNKGVTEGKQARVLKFDSSEEYSTLELVPEQPWNWTDLGSMNVAFDATNPGDVSVHLFLRVKDSSGWPHTRSISIPAGSTGTYYADLSGEQLSTDSGLRADPPAWPSDEYRMPWMHGKKELDLSDVRSVSLYVQTNLENKTLIVDNVRARSNPAIDDQYLVGLVDKFGQAVKLDTPNKVQSDEHLKELAEQELADLAANPVLPDRSKFGGWKDGPKLQGTGFFRTEKVGDTWALVDPEGYLFFSSGIANVRIANTTTFTGVDFKDDSVRYIDPEDVTPEDSLGIRPVSAEAQKTGYVESDMRRNMFTWLPEYDDELANHYSYRRTSHKGPMHHGETYSFYQANLERRYGETSPDSYIRDWEDVTVKRMRSWGMTSFGNWVDPAFYQRNQYPYFANGWIIGDYKTVTSSGDAWSPMPDPYDPEFARRARATTDAIAAEVQNNPWCIGVFIDNEKSWGNKKTVKGHYRIPIQALFLDAKDSPAKHAFSELLKEKYGSIDKLNTAWQASVASWESLDKSFTVNDINEALKADLSMMLEAYSTKYFQVVHDALEAVMPDHMYMGVRMAAWGVTPEGVTAATKYVDVMSYNYYREGMHPKMWSFLEEYDMPSIIGEYHMGARDSGLYHPGLIHAADQADRGRMYKDYMHTVIDNPYMVGGHWFQYTDSPITGRAYDGENYNVGFVNNVDVPYKEMVKAARELNSDLYPRRFDDAVKTK